MDSYLVLFLGFLVGAIANTVYAYAFKKQADGSISFDKTYLYTMIATVVVAMVTSPVTFQASGLVEMYMSMPSLDLGTFMMFLSAFGVGFSGNYALNKPVSAYKASRA